MESLAYAVCCSLFLAATAQMLKHRNLSFAITGDEDMKIASPGNFSPSKSEDSGELAAEQFLQQKQLGNISRARKLGLQYAQILLDKPPSLFEPTTDQLLLHHQYLLFSYAVNRAIAEGSPNSILAQTSLNVFYATVEESSPELAEHLRDTGAYSLYILCQRSHIRSLDKIGGVYAELIQRPDDPVAIEHGNTLYQNYMTYCLNLLKQTQYILP